MSLPHQNILELIPQAPPFVMVDVLLYTDELSSRSRFIIKPDNVMVQNGCFTEGGLLENIAQTAAARAGYLAKQNHQPVAGGFDRRTEARQAFIRHMTDDQGGLGGYGDGTHATAMPFTIPK